METPNKHGSAHEAWLIVALLIAVEIINGIRQVF